MIVDKKILRKLWDIFNKKRMIDSKLLKQLILSYRGVEIYILDILGEKGDMNIKSLADTLYMTRGAISKLAGRLEQRGIVRCYKRDGNNREVYLTLTEEGQADFKRHCKMRKAIDDDMDLNSTSVETQEANAVLKILNDYNEKLDMQMKKFDVHLS